MSSPERTNPSSEQIPNSPTDVKPIDIAAEAGDSKSSDDDVLEILEDLETYAENMKDDFLGDSAAQNTSRKAKRPGVCGFMDLMLEGPWKSNEEIKEECKVPKRKRGKRMRKCPICSKNKRRGCKCPKPVQATTPKPAQSATPKRKRRHYEFPPMYRTPVITPIVVPFPIVLPIHPSRTGPFFYHA
ncbi:uncharacterized protein LOC107048240 [Diachasma alloeum]|uniref:uncharacterized protein LOC107048240 n=1 Tax=Diachasma alloeum TaxID=454923 RepID=UPI00073827FB|nr:uncharacterized protein LOC107048240 [Diachasma alloeum]